MSRFKKSNRSWWRERFLDHPGFADKNQDAFVESGLGATKATKVYCAACLVADTEKIIQEDLHAIDQGRITMVRGEAEIIAYRELID